LAYAPAAKVRRGNRLVIPADFTQYVPDFLQLAAGEYWRDDAEPLIAARVLARPSQGRLYRLKFQAAGSVHHHHAPQIWKPECPS
jgi:hypothetical protein